jgi:hypothetical protein
VVVGAGAALAVVCVVWCGLALWCGFAGFFAAFVVVGVVGGWAVFAELELDDDAPQPAATRASDTAVTQRIRSRVIRISTEHDACGLDCFPGRSFAPRRCYGIPTSELSPTMNR